MPTPTYPTDPYVSFPVTAALEFDTQVVTAKDGTEQRWMNHAGRASWVLSYPHLSVAQRDTLLAFFDARLGSKETFDFAFLGTTYEGCYFDADQFSATENQPTYCSASVKICKAVRSADTGSLPSAFPSLANGNPTQRPYTHAHEWDTVAVRTEGGRFASANRSSAIRTWTVGGPMLTLADAQAIWDMFSQAQGMYRSFAFDDPDSGDTYTVRFGADTLEWKFVDAGHNTIQTTLREVL